MKTWVGSTGDNSGYDTCHKCSQQGDEQANTPRGAPTWRSYSETLSICLGLRSGLPAADLGGTCVWGIFGGSGGGSDKHSCPNKLCLLVKSLQSELSDLKHPACPA